MVLCWPDWSGTRLLDTSGALSMGSKRMSLDGWTVGDVFSEWWVLTALGMSCESNMKWSVDSWSVF